MQAVLNDSLGAARTAAEAIDAQGGVMQVPVARTAELLGRELSSGEYVRALFVATPNRFVSALRNHNMQALDTPPEWLQPAFSETRDVYIGRTIADPVQTVQRAIPRSEERR